MLTRGDRLPIDTRQLFAGGRVRRPIYGRLGLGDARRAHELLDAREVLGKLILQP